MILRVVGATKLLTGEKSQFCFPCRNGMVLNGDAIVSRHGDGRAVCKAGSWYTFGERSITPTMGRVKVVGVEVLEYASDLTEEEARAEGYASVEEFRAGYAKEYGAVYLDRPCFKLTLAEARMAT